MRNTILKRRQLAVLLLAIIFIFSMAASLMSVPVFASEYEPTKDIPTRDIAIVFDNSGSMYENGNNAWCRAIYSMEVFASLLNEEDRLSIYPMGEIETGGSTYSMDNPLVVKGSEIQPEIIRDIYTPEVPGTPIESIDTAYQGLTADESYYDEHWLIVLTDGTMFSEGGENNYYTGENGTRPTEEVLSERLSEYNNEDVKVLYLGIGNDAATPSIDNTQDDCVFKAENSAEILSNLVKIGNIIFGRDEFPDAMTDGEDLNVDISMSELILFVQGDNTEDIQLTGTENTLEAPKTYNVRYGDKGGNLTGHDEYKGSLDTSLKGKLLIYQNVKPGSYTISGDADGVEVNVYYEPSVKVHVEVTDENGTLADQLEKDELLPGNYRVAYWIVDKSVEDTSDESMVESALLGDQVDYDIQCTVNGEPVTASNPVNEDYSGYWDVYLNEYDTLSVSGTVTFLSGYRVDVNDEMVVGMPDDGLTIPPNSLDIEQSDGQPNYDLSSLPNEAKYTFDLSYTDSNGEIQTLTDEELQQIIAEGGVDLRAGDLQVEPTVENGQLCCTLDYNGTPDDTDCGPYTLEGTISYNLDGDTLAAEIEPVNFTVNDDTPEITLALSPGSKEYTRSKLTSSDPLVLSVSEDGGPVTDPDEISYLNSVISKDNLEILDQEGNPVTWENLSLENVPGTSEYNLSFTDKEGVDLGKYTVSYQQDFVRNDGKTVSAETEPSYLTIRRIPRWLKWLLIIASILLIALIIFLISNMKVLPKRIVFQKADTYGTASGVKVATAPKPKMNGNGKKKGNLRITSNPPPVDAMAKTYLSLDLVAVDPRRTKSKRRHAYVVGGKTQPNSTVTINGTALKSDQRGNLQQPDGKPINRIRIGDNTTCNVISKVHGIKNNVVSVTMNVTLKFE